MLCQIQKSHALFLSAVISASTLLLNGCATYSETPLIAQTSIEPVPSVEEPIEVIRSGRYKLLEITPEEGQRHLLKQSIHTRIPRLQKDPPKVGFAMRYLLADSGYRLCPDTPATQSLDNLPLPLVHSQIGPMRLQEALVMLAGPAWLLTVDDLSREVCFELVLDDTVASKEK